MMRNYILAFICIAWLVWAWFYIAKPTKEALEPVQQVVSQVEDWADWLDSITNMEIIE